MSLEYDDFVFRKVNWLLPLRSEGWVGFRLTAKLPLRVTKPNCRRSLRYKYFIFALAEISKEIYIVLQFIGRYRRRQTEYMYQKT